MAEPPVLPAPGWYRLGTRVTAGLMQLGLWVLLAGFYFAWNNRPNYQFRTPVWPLVVLEMGYAVLLFNSLVYLLIPRWLLRAATPSPWPAGCCCWSSTTSGPTPASS